MTDRPNNAITEDIVRIRDTYELTRSDRDALADAANRIQAQGKALAGDGLDLHDAATHRDSWLSAFDELIGHDAENEAYWRHERKALADFLDTLAQTGMASA